MFAPQKTKSQLLKEKSDKVMSIFTSAYQDMHLVIAEQEKLSSELDDKITALKVEQDAVENSIKANNKFLAKLKDFVEA